MLVHTIILKVWYITMHHKLSQLIKISSSHPSLASSNYCRPFITYAPGSTLHLCESECLHRWGHDCCTGAAYLHISRRQHLICTYDEGCSLSYLLQLQRCSTVNARLHIFLRIIRKKSSKTNETETAVKFILYKLIYLLMLR